MKALYNVFRIILGIVFVFSGFVKVVDPMGVEFKFVDYFFAMGLDFLEPAALTFGVLLSAAELLIGISLLFNLLPKIGAWGVMLFMIVFLPLTLWIAIADPVQDCGCFGDAIILTNWETFWKNVVIMAMTIPVFLKRKTFKPRLPQSIQWLMLLIFGGATIWFSIYCLNHLPIMDFRPYRIGNNIQEGMEIPDSEKDNLPVYETVVVYENTETGKTKEFDSNNIPEGDKWEWKETKNKLIEEGYQPPIHDFSITTMPLQFEDEHEQAFIEPEVLFDATYMFDIDGHTEEFPIDELPTAEWEFMSVNSDYDIKPQNIGLIYERNGDSKEFTVYDLPATEDWKFVDAIYYNPEDSSDETNNQQPEDITDLVLADDSYTFIIISWDVLKVKNKYTEKLHDLHDFCDVNDIPCLFLTSSTENDVKTFVEETNAPFDFYSTDPITLKTMVRSNPGIMLIKKGTILDKWHINGFPDVKDLDDRLIARSLEKQVVKKEKYFVWMLGFGILIFYALIHIFINYLRRKNIIVEKRSWE
ncbi:MAG: BT_3928 family protein [Bacteroidota bacterium]